MSMQGSRVGNREMISSDRSSPFSLAFPVTKLSKTSGAASTSSAGDCSPFWTEPAKAVSEKLWLPTETVLQDLDSTSSNTSWNAKVLDSLCSTTRVRVRRQSSSRTLFPSCMFSLVGSTDSAATKRRLAKKRKAEERENNLTVSEREEMEAKQEEKRRRFADKKAAVANEKRLRRGLGLETEAEKEEREQKAAAVSAKISETKAKKKEERRGKVLRARKYSLKPTTEQRQVLRQWFGSARLTYNKAIEGMNKSEDGTPSIECLRSDLVYTDAPFVTEGRTWLLDTPKEIRANAIRDARKALSSNLQKRRLNPGHTFRLRFRSRKDSQAIEIPKTAMKTFGRTEHREGVARIFPTTLGDVSFHLGKGETVVEPAGDLRLSLDRVGAFFLHVPHLVAVGGKKPSTETSRVAAVDPGVRTFASVYSADGLVAEIGDNIAPLEKLERVRNKLRALAKRERGEGRKARRPARDALA